MTKPKTVSALLAEANKLARERGCYWKHYETYSRQWLAQSWSRPMINVFSESEELALRCLVAALREVPVKKARKR